MSDDDLDTTTTTTSHCLSSTSDDNSAAAAATAAPPASKKKQVHGFIQIRDKVFQKWTKDSLFISAVPQKPNMFRYNMCHIKSELCTSRC